MSRLMAVVAAGVGAWLLGTAMAAAQLPGGWREVPAKDQQVQEAAKFAVKAQGEKDKKTCKLDKVEKAEQQVVAGMNYRLRLKVKTDDGVKEATVVVWRKLDKTHQLTSWKWVAADDSGAKPGEEPKK